MGYVTNTYRVNRSIRYGYPSLCGQELLTGTGFVTPDTERNVTSYRGPTKYINVGRKRRKAFNSFNVFQYKHYGEPSIDTWCPKGAPGHTMYGHDILFSWYRSRWDAHVSTGVDMMASGTKWPIAGLANHEEVAKPYRDECMRDLFVKLYEPRWDGAVFFAELLETLVSIRELIWGAIKVFTKTGKALKYLTHFSLNSEELWLWYRYCLMPAMLDANDLLAAIQPQVKIDRCQTGRPKKKYTLRGQLVSQNYWFPPHNVPLIINWSQSVKIGAGAATDITSRFDPNEWGFSTRDLLRAGWERVPFSYIFDWFVGVGDFLTTIRDVEIAHAQSYATYAIETVLRFHGGPDITQSVSPVVKHFQMDRTLDVEPPNHPMVNKDWMSILRVVDSISLAAGVIKNILGKKRMIKYR